MRPTLVVHLSTSINIQYDNPASLILVLPESRNQILVLQELTIKIMYNTYSPCVQSSLFHKVTSDVEPCPTLLTFF